jgi:hypothetical protein
MNIVFLIILTALSDYFAAAPPAGVAEAPAKGQAEY